MPFLYDHMIKLKPKEVFGAMVILDQQEIKQIDLIKLKKEKKEVLVVEKKSHIHFSDLPQENQVPIYLALDGKGVLHKRVNRSENEDLISVAKNNFPNLKPGELHFQYAPVGDQEGILSVIRKSDVEQVSSQLQSKGFYVCGISLGAFALGIFAQIQEFTGNIEVDHYNITIENGLVITSKFIEQRLSENNYKFGEEEVSSTFLLPYCIGLQHFISSFGIPGLELPELGQAQYELAHKQLSGILIKAVPIGLLILLLINFGLYSYYQQENARLEIAYGKAKHKLELLNELNADLKLKKELFSSIGSIGSIHLPYFADQIGANLVEGIQLSRLSLSPLDQKELDNNRTWMFQSGSIQIAGFCPGTAELNAWISRMDTLNWVKSIDYPKFSRNITDNRGEFEVTIQVRGYDQ